VAQDERDRGLRQLLNLGHTVGHAIETSTGYARYRHGEAVGLGLLAELRLSDAGELREHVRQMMVAQGLPTRLEDADVEEVVSATSRDKKRMDGPVPFVLCKAPGRPILGQTVAPEDLRAAVRELTIR
jgi:shikimate kinase/3-dehydroquinate synthase